MGGAIGITNRSRMRLTLKRKSDIIFFVVVTDSFFTLSKRTPLSNSDRPRNNNIFIGIRCAIVILHCIFIDKIQYIRHPLE